MLVAVVGLAMVSDFRGLASQHRQQAEASTSALLRRVSDRLLGVERNQRDMDVIEKIVARAFLIMGSGMTLISLSALAFGLSPQLAGGECGRSSTLPPSGSPLFAPPCRAPRQLASPPGCEALGAPPGQPPGRPAAPSPGPVSWLPPARPGQYARPVSSGSAATTRPTASSGLAVCAMTSPLSRTTYRASRSGSIEYPTRAYGNWGRVENQSMK